MRHVTPSALAVACAVVALSCPLLHAASSSPAGGPRAEPWLQVSENRRFLVTADGTPFFWLGDTAWELFHRTTFEEADMYLRQRAALGFTVIQAVALAELDGLRTPNSYGHLPLEDLDPARPLTRDGPGNDYWDHVDAVIDHANSLGLAVALLPTWGDKWNLAWGVGPVVFSPENARRYGEWIGRRYRDRRVIWLLGGDRQIENDTHRAIVVAMADGVRAGDDGRNLVSFHPSGSRGSSDWFHQEPWLAFNLRQNGHHPEYKEFHKTLLDYQRTPAKPVIDGEPLYEDHPISFKQAEFGHAVSADVRRPLYWNLFNGAFGHTYGHHSVWQMYLPGRPPVNDPLLPWTEALAQPGAAQMRHGRALLESRPFLSRIPDPGLIKTEAPVTAWPGAGRYRLAATRDEEGSYAMIYTPVGRRFTVNLTSLSGTTLRAWWFNPRDGTAEEIGRLEKTEERSFQTPAPGEWLDWVLVLDDAAKGYAAPGRPR